MPRQHAQSILSNEDQNSPSLNFRYSDLAPHNPGLLSQIDENPSSEEAEEASKIADEAPRSEEAAKIAEEEGTREEEEKAQIVVKSNQTVLIAEIASPTETSLFTRRSPTADQSPSNISTIEASLQSPDNNDPDNSTTSCCGFFAKFLNRKRAAVTALATTQSVNHPKIP